MTSSEVEGAERRMKASNAWGKLKAELEAEMFANLPQEHASRATPNARGARFNLSHEGRLAAGLIEDVLQVLGMASTLRVFKTEAAVRDGLSRGEIQRTLDLRGEAAEPLLSDVVRRALAREVSSTEPTSAPRAAQSAPAEPGLDREIPPVAAASDVAARSPPAMERTPEALTTTPTERGSPVRATEALVERNANDASVESPTRAAPRATTKRDGASAARDAFQTTTRLGAASALDGSYADESDEIAVDELDESVHDASMSYGRDARGDTGPAAAAAGAGAAAAAESESEAMEIDYEDAAGGDDGDESFAAGSAPMGSSEYDAGGASPEEEAFELDVEDVY